MIVRPEDCDHQDYDTEQGAFWDLVLLEDGRLRCELCGTTFRPEPLENTPPSEVK